MFHDPPLAWIRLIAAQRDGDVRDALVALIDQVIVVAAEEQQIAGARRALDDFASAELLIGIPRNGHAHEAPERLRQP